MAGSNIRELFSARMRKRLKSSEDARIKTVKRSPEIKNLEINQEGSTDLHFLQKTDLVQQVKGVDRKHRHKFVQELAKKMDGENLTLCIPSLLFPILLQDNRVRSQFQISFRKLQITNQEGETIDP